MSDSTRVRPRKPAIGVLGWCSILAAASIVGWLIIRSMQHAGAHTPAATLPRMWQVGSLPFAALLAAIASLPLIRASHHWWESNLHRLWVSLGCAAMTLVYYAVAEGPGRMPDVLEHAVVGEYVPFIMLLLALYVISGGINLRGDLPAHPLTNTTFLAIGGVIASLVGTTGASMLLIRPLLTTNSERRHVTHTVVFFIFIVSNVGGCLLPIGDPPLFLGYLKGVPFTWTLILWKEWAFCLTALLGLYFIVDSIAYHKERVRDVICDEKLREPLRLTGWINFAWLAGTVLAVAFLDSHNTIPGTNWKPFPFLRELVLVGLVVASLLTTPRGVRRANRFNYAAILEVAALFIGIFITMQVPIEVLNIKGAALGLEHPWQFFWMTGGLSSVLDNAPTYVVFFETANAMTHTPGPGILQLLSGHYIREDLLVGISLGAVFMGANTYIGNGPNFMVKSIAEQMGVRMPSFFGFVFKYSLPILIPLFVLVTWLFVV